MHAAIRVLADAVGPEKAITLDDLTVRAGIPCRRETEELMELGLSRMPFLLVADKHGYYQPTDADQINRYTASLRSRAVKAFMRARTVRRKAFAHGWRREGSRFVRPATQGELFDCCRAGACAAPVPGLEHGDPQADALRGTEEKGATR